MGRVILGLQMIYVRVCVCQELVENFVKGGVSVSLGSTPIVKSRTVNR